MDIRNCFYTFGKQFATLQFFWVFDFVIKFFFLSFTYSCKSADTTVQLKMNK